MAANVVKFVEAILRYDMTPQNTPILLHKIDFQWFSGAYICIGISKSHSEKIMITGVKKVQTDITRVEIKF